MDPVRSTPNTGDHPGHQGLTASVVTVGALLADRRLQIPSYQRPYSWGAVQVSQLVDDVETFRPSGAYRLGSIIVHRDGEDLDVVDGQQRYLTFGLVAAALATALPADSQQRDLVTGLVSGIALPERWDGRTDQRLRENALRLDGIFSAWSHARLEAFADFFLHRCSVIQLAVPTLDEAFQMFDSQNTRGRALDPTDLLKAYHLREFAGTRASAEDVLAAVTRWEVVPPAEISHLFGDLLFPTLRWSSGQALPPGGFAAADIGAFKGVRPSAPERARRWAHPVLMAQAYVEEFEARHRRLIDQGLIPALPYPFQLTLPVIDGEMFFRMVEHYVCLTRRLGVAEAEPAVRETEDRQRAERGAGEQAVLDAVRRADTGTGARYVRLLFGCLLLAYADRFGEDDLADASDLLARHAFLLRASLRRVQRSSVENHALGQHGRVPERHRLNLFALLAQAHDPAELLRRDRATIDDVEDRDRLDPEDPVMVILSPHARTATATDQEGRP